MKYTYDPTINQTSVDGVQIPADRIRYTVYHHPPKIACIGCSTIVRGRYGTYVTEQGLHSWKWIGYICTVCRPIDMQLADKKRNDVILKGGIF